MRLRNGRSNLSISPITSMRHHATGPATQSAPFYGGVGGRCRSQPYVTQILTQPLGVRHALQFVKRKEVVV